jgi:2-isopropylmalate synthase
MGFYMSSRQPSAVDIYDTTLRDGSQTTGVNFSLQDKIDITLKLDEIGVHFIEGGQPASNPKDDLYFERIRDYSLASRIVAFGSTMRKDTRVEEDPNLSPILESGVNCVTIFGKSSPFHVRKVLRTNLRRNIEMIAGSIQYLRDHGLEVIYDAEHFYDGYREDPAYALQTLKAADGAGASVIVLCDTNGGCLPDEISSTTSTALESFDAKSGFHGHNDSGCAVANTIAAVRAGVEHVQGTVNGLGERCGNADLCVLLPGLEHKLGISTVNRGMPKAERLTKLKEISEYVYELTGMRRNPHQPYVGGLAFSHKGGIHTDAVGKHPSSYEHIEPDLVGNSRQISVSELSGKASIISKGRDFGFRLQKGDATTSRILARVKSLEREGYHLLNADATVYMIMAEELGRLKDTFQLIEWRTLSSSESAGPGAAEATVKVKVGEEVVHTIAEGDGPVNAQDNALRKALLPIFPRIGRVNLTNYKVTVINMEGTASSVEVFIEFSGDGERWSTVGVSENILEASKIALVQGYKYFLQLNGA